MERPPRAKVPETVRAKSAKSQCRLGFAVPFESRGVMKIGKIPLVQEEFGNHSPNDERRQSSSFDASLRRIDPAQL